MEFSQFIVIILVAIVSYLLGLKNGSNGGGSESAAGFMVDKATGVQFPTNKKFISSKKNELSCGKLYIHPNCSFEMSTKTLHHSLNTFTYAPYA